VVPCQNKIILAKWQSDSRQSGTLQGAGSDSQPVTKME